MQLLPLCFAYAISFLGAFLLFLLQPMVSKSILPVLGGTPAVWNACMVCFQLLLLSGYLYAHILGKAGSVRRQALVHAVVFVCALAVWPLSAESLRSTPPQDNPLLWVIVTLLTRVGLPFFFLAATAPLLQRWVSLGTGPLADSPYRLYSASNAGSFSALIGFVLLVEPSFTLPAQFYAWSVIFMAFAFALIALGITTRERERKTTVTAPESDAPPGVRTKALWVLLALIPSSLMLGVTTYITTDIAAIPLLWVLPLSLYLLSFVSAFSERPFLINTAQQAVIICGIALVTYGIGVHVFTAIYALHIVSFTIACFAVHGILAKRKPGSAHLTGYYVWISFGGLLGGMFNTLLAPQIFSGIAEYPIALALAILVVVLLAGAREKNMLATPLGRLALCCLPAGFALIILPQVLALGLSVDKLWLAGAVGFLLALIFAVFFKDTQTRPLLIFMMAALPIGLAAQTVLQPLVLGATLYHERNFFGSISVRHSPKENMNLMIYNTTLHGGQRRAPEHRTQPTFYYAPVKMMLAEIFLPRPPFHRKAVIGLGTGTLQCSNHADDHVDYYEINPAVPKIATTPDYFSFLSDCPGNYVIHLGDGRLKIAEAQPQTYDVILLDAFSSDAIPSHLLTMEAIALYRSKLSANGILMFHITNRHLALAPLLALQSRISGAVGWTRSFNDNSKEAFSSSSDWFVMKFNSTPAFARRMEEAGWTKPSPLPGAQPWTDDYSNLLPYLLARQGHN